MCIRDSPQAERSVPDKTVNAVHAGVAFHGVVLWKVNKCGFGYGHAPDEHTGVSVTKRTNRKSAPAVCMSPFLGTRSPPKVKISLLGHAFCWQQKLDKKWPERQAPSIRLPDFCNNHGVQPWLAMPRNPAGCPGLSPVLGTRSPSRSPQNQWPDGRAGRAAIRYHFCSFMCMPANGRRPICLLFRLAGACHANGESAARRCC